MARNRRLFAEKSSHLNVNKQKPSADVRNLGPTSRICQINIEGVSRDKGEYLSKFLADKNVAVLLIQETHTESDAELNNRFIITGYDLIVAQHSRAHALTEWQHTPNAG